MPGAVEVGRHETVKHELFAVIGQALVAEPRWNPLDPEQGSQEMRLAVAASDALAERP